MAPSPIATVRARGSPSSRGELAQRGGLPGAVDDLAHDPAGEQAVGDLEPVGPYVVDAELERDRLDDLEEAARHDRHGEAEALEGAHQGAGAGGEAHGIAHLVEHRRGQAGQRGDPGVQALGEVELAAHGGLGDCGDLGGPAGVLGEQLDDLVLDQRGVDVHHDEPTAAAGQAGRGHGDVGTDLVGHHGEVLPQVPDVGARHVELDGGHGVAREPPDAVDVGAVVGDRGGDGRHVVGLERGAHQHDRGPAGAARSVVTVADLEVDPHPEGRAGAGQPVDEHVLVAPGGQQHRQGEVSAHDDLLEVEHLGPDRRRRLEQRLGHAGPVGPVERDEQGACAGVGQGSRGGSIGAGGTGAG